MPSSPTALPIPPDEDPRLRRSGLLGGIAFFALATSLLLPWWVVSDRVGAVDTVAGTVFPFGSGQGVTSAWAQLLTGLLVAGAGVWLFVRVASRARVHEPATWHRDLGLQAALVALGLASAWLWPKEWVFWGTQRVAFGNQTGDGTLLIATNPGLGWWVGLVGLAFLAWAWWMSRPLASAHEV